METKTAAGKLGWFQLACLEHALGQRERVRTTRRALLADWAITSLYLSCCEAGMRWTAGQLLALHRQRVLKGVRE